MAEDRVAPEAGLLPKARSKVEKRERVAEKRAAQRVGSRTEQNATRGYLSRMTSA